VGNSDRLSFHKVAYINYDVPRFTEQMDFAFGCTVFTFQLLTMISYPGDSLSTVFMIVMELEGVMENVFQYV
jgi:hypothetical protein